MTHVTQRIALRWLAWTLVFLPLAAAAESIPVEVDEERSRLEAKVSATLHSFTAEVTDFEAEIYLGEAGQEVRLARLLFRVKDVDTGNDTRNSEMLEWLGAQEHPRISFALQEAAKADGQWRATGELRMAGVARQIEFPFELVRQDGEVTIRGSYQLDHREWDLPVIRKFFLKVDPVLEVEFELWGKALSDTDPARGGDAKEAQEK